jgi:pseudaminic acid biosynthesis-associated methylase
LKPEQFWAGEFGNDYVDRCRVDWHARLPFWESAIHYCMPASVLEVGCNAGWNLLAIHEISPSVQLHGIDINSKAVEQARQAGIEAMTMPAIPGCQAHGAESMDLVFTAGVLIHVPPEDLAATMRAIVDASAKYVIAIEYEADEEEEVEYRGHKGKLWKRPFGKLYEDMGLRLLSVVPDATGFDKCTAWLLEKP